MKKLRSFSAAFLVQPVNKKQELYKKIDAQTGGLGTLMVEELGK